MCFPFSVHIRQRCKSRYLALLSYHQSPRNFLELPITAVNMKSFKFRFLRRVKVWHLLYILAIVTVYFILTSSTEKEKPKRKAPELQAPKVNALLSTGLAKLRGNTFHDVGEILDHLAMEDVSCVPFKAAHRKVKICIYDLARDEVVSKSLKMYETWESDQLHFKSRQGTRFTRSRRELGCVHADRGGHGT